MNHSRIIDGVVTSTSKASPRQRTNQTGVATTKAVAPALALADEDVQDHFTPEEILCKAGGGYQWFNPANRQQALAYVTALLLAYRHGLKTQVALYQSELSAILAKDRADYAAHQAGQLRSYHGRFEHTSGLARRPFDFYHAFSAAEGMKSWTVSDVNAFSQRIPLAALQTLDGLYAQGVIPDRIWVAAERSMPSAARPDPYLLFSFGSYFVAVAKWG